MSRRARTTLGILLSLLLLWWALRDVSFGEVATRIVTADRPLLALSVVVALSGFWIRAWRWGLLLLPLGSAIPFRPRLGATFVGFAVNNLLPARIGEFARAYSLARLTSIRLPSVLATLVVERLLDGLVLVALLFAAMAAPGFPAGGRIGGLDVRTGTTAIAIAMWGLITVLFLAATAPQRVAKLAHLAIRLLPPRLQHPAIEAMRSFAGGLAVLRNPKLFLASVALAAGQWSFLALSYLLGFRAFGIDDVPFSGAVFLQSLISLAVALPSSPGFFGPFEAATRVGLGVWEVPVEQAISFAIGYHIAGFIPVTLIGVYYVWRLDLSWSEVRHSEEVAEEEMEPGDPALPSAG